jgi:hypothetical protein
MTHSARSISHSTNSKPSRALRCISAVAVAGALSIPGDADAKTVRSGTYDGTWNVTFATRAGNCSSANNVPFSVVGTRVSSAGGGKVTGGISRAGVVSVNIQVGASHASGSGRLFGNSGSGRWSGIITGDRCSGSWQATRS